MLWIWDKYTRETREWKSTATFKDSDSPVVVQHVVVACSARSVSAKLCRCVIINDRTAHDSSEQFSLKFLIALANMHFNYISHLDTTRRENKEKIEENLFQLSLNVSFYESEENLSNFDRHTMCGSGSSRRERFDIPRKNSQVRLSSGGCVMSVWRKNVGKSMFGEQNKMKNGRL